MFIVLHDNIVIRPNITSDGGAVNIKNEQGKAGHGGLVGKRYPWGDEALTRVASMGQTTALQGQRIIVIWGCIPDRIGWLYVMPPKTLDKLTMIVVE